MKNLQPINVQSFSSIPAAGVRSAATETAATGCTEHRRHLAVTLLRTEQSLRQMRNKLDRQALSRYATKPRHLLKGGAVQCGTDARAGTGTTTWRGAGAALWGVLPLPLYRAAPLAGVVLLQNTPRPADCWPFRGSRGEVIIELSEPARVTLFSIQHVRPDSALSAPARFTLYGILSNGTRVAGYEGEYRADRPAQQWFRSGLKARISSVALRVLSNHGNGRYTCIYRVQVYTSGPRHNIV